MTAGTEDHAPRCLLVVQGWRPGLSKIRNTIFAGQMGVWILTERTPPSLFFLKPPGWSLYVSK
jgi:hypothetical protein